jgi:hypothetical protein
MRTFIIIYFLSIHIMPLLESILLSLSSLIDFIILYFCWCWLAPVYIFYYDFDYYYLKTMIIILYIYMIIHTIINAYMIIPRIKTKQFSYFKQITCWFLLDAGDLLFHCIQLINYSLDTQEANNLSTVQTHFFN